MEIQLYMIIWYTDVTAPYTWIVWDVTLKVEAAFSLAFCNIECRKQEEYWATFMCHTFSIQYLSPVPANGTLQTLLQVNGLVSIRAPSSLFKTRDSI